MTQTVRFLCECGSELSGPPGVEARCPSCHEWQMAPPTTDWSLLVEDRDSPLLQEVFG